MRPISVTLGPYTAGSANGIATSQSLAAAGNFTLNGSLVANGVAILDNPRQVKITSSGNDTAVQFMVSGYIASGIPYSETISGANGGSVTTNNMFKLVTGVYANGATTNVTIGTTSAPASSPAIRLDEWADAPLGVQVAVTGTVNFTVEHSFDEGPDSLVSPIPIASMFWDTSLIPNGAINSNSGISFSMAAAPLWMKILLNSGSGSVRMVLNQYNVTEV